MIWMAALLMLAGAGVLLLAARGHRPVHHGPALVSPLQDQLARLGLPRSLWMDALGLATVLALVLITWGHEGGMPALGVLLVSSLAIMVIAQIRRERQRRLILHQLPGFIGQLSRRVVTGMSVGKAFERAVDEAKMPLQGVLRRALQRVQLGDDLANCMDRKARITGVQEFYLLASILRVHYQFGGSITAALEHLVKLLHQRERAHRELWAMTGETRVTAIVLGAVPLLMVLYMLMANRRYLLSLWQDDTGQLLLLGAGALQALGSVILWRMLRSV